MYQDNIQREIINWNIKTLQAVTPLVDLIHRHQHKQPPNPHDHILRDFYYHPSLNLFGLKNRISFIEQSADVIKNFISFNHLGYLQSVHFEHLMQKHRFWNKLYKQPIKNKADHQMRQNVRSIVWTYRMFPLALFLFGTATILQISGVYRMRIQKQLVALLIGAFLSDVMVRSKKSSDIFYLIPKLPDQTLEQQRINIMNKSIVLDGRINSIEQKPKFVQELIEEAQKEENQQERINILEAAGFKVITSKDQACL